MPKTRQRAKKPVEKGRNTYSKADRKKIEDAYKKKFEHYSTYTIEQLETILASKSERGTYLHALLQVMKAKKRAPRENIVDKEESIIPDGPVGSIEPIVAPQIEK